VLQNWRKHVPGARGLDARSSASWFTGWRTAVARAAETAPVVPARSWLARVGWRRYGLLGVDEHPRTHTGSPQYETARRPSAARSLWVSKDQ
jgi:hypothetical protein